MPRATLAAIPVVVAVYAFPKIRAVRAQSEVTRVLDIAAEEASPRLIAA